MALDFAIMGSSGAPVEQVGVDADVHWRLILAARSSNAVLLLRTDDYYADAEYERHELPRLEAEVDRVARAVDGDAELLAVLAEVKAIVNTAWRTGRGISVLSD